jgi:prepilin-type N-terminal cleavage/methylation domain-containing protein
LTKKQSLGKSLSAFPDDFFGHKPRIKKLKMKMIASKKTGFSLVELTIVVVILGILATFAVPRFMTSVEKTKASEAFSYLAQIESAQGRYNAEHGRYASNTNQLDIDLDRPEFFSVSGPYSSNWETKWEMRLTRNGASSGYGRYTVTFDQDGYNKSKSTIDRDLAPAL